MATTSPEVSRAVLETGSRNSHRVAEALVWWCDRKCKEVDGVVIGQSMY